MKSLLNSEVADDVKGRLDKLTAASQPLWGKMSSGQTMRHCQVPLEIMLGKKDYGLKPNWLVNVFFKKSMYNDKLWRKNLPTAKVMKQTEDHDFDMERSKLLSLIDELSRQPDKEWGSHPSFGYFTNEQWGKMQYKHLDHHLRQFGV